MLYSLGLQRVRHNLVTEQQKMWFPVLFFNLNIVYYEVSVTPLTILMINRDRAYIKVRI